MSSYNNEIQINDEENKSEEEDFIKKEDNTEKLVDSRVIGKRDDTDPHVKYNKWKKRRDEEVKEEKSRYKKVTENLSNTEELKIFKKQNCSFQCLVPISKRQKRKDFYLCCINRDLEMNNEDSEMQMVICRECAKICHKETHLKELKEKLSNISENFKKMKNDKHEIRTKILALTRKKKESNINAEELTKEIDSFKADLQRIKNSLTKEEKSLAKEFNLAYEYEKYNCNKNKLEVGKKEDKFLENYAEKYLKQFKIPYQMNYELKCECSHSEITNQNISDEIKCTYTNLFTKTKETTNFYRFEEYRLTENINKTKHEHDLEERVECKKINHKISLGLYIEERKIAEERRKLLTSSGMEKFDKREQKILKLDDIIAKKDEEPFYYCAFCVNNCIMPHFQFKKNLSHIPIPVEIDKSIPLDNPIKGFDTKKVSCRCNQHDEDIKFDFTDNILDYKLNLSFNNLFNFKTVDRNIKHTNFIEKYLQNFDKIDFNNYQFLYSLEIFRIFDLFYNTKYYIPSYHFLENLNIDKENTNTWKDDKNDETTQNHIESETLKIINSFCRKIDKKEYRMEEIDYECLNRSFSSKIILLYMIFYKTTKSFVVQHFYHFNINSIVNMTICQRYMYLRNIFENKEDSIIFKNQFLLYIDIFLSYMTEDLLSNNLEDVDNDNYSLIHKIFKLIFKFNLSKIYNRRTDKINNKNNSVVYLLEKRYLSLVYKTFIANKANRRRCLSESSYYILKSLFYIIYRLNDMDYVKMIQNKDKFNLKDHEKVFYKGELSENICKVTIMVLDGYDMTKIPSRSLKFQLYTKYILDVIIDKNKHYNIGINNLQYLKASSFDVFLNPKFIEDYKSSKNNKDINKFLDPFEKLNWRYMKNEIEYDNYVIKCSEFLSEIIEIAKSYIKNWNEINLTSNKIEIYKIVGKISDIENFQKIIKFNKFISIFDCFIYNYSEANIKDVRKTACKERLSFELRKNLLILFIMLIYDNPENLNLIMSFDGKSFAHVFLQIFNREEVNYSTNEYFSEIDERHKWKKNTHEDNEILQEKYRQLSMESIGIECFLKFLSVTSDIICYSKYQFINLKYFTDSMIEACKFISEYRNGELEILKLLKKKKSSGPDYKLTINKLIEDKFQFFQIYLNHYKDTIGESDEEKNILEKIKKEEFDDEYFKWLNNVYDQELIDIVTCESVAKVTLYMGRFLKIFCNIFRHMTLMKTESLDCLEHVVNIIKNSYASDKIFNFSIEKFVKSKIPLYEKDSVEVFMKNYLKFYCSVYYNSLSFMRIFKYDVIVGSIFSALKKDCMIPEKLPLTLQMEIVKFTFIQIEIDFDLQQPINQEIPFKSEYFWMAQKKPRFLYETDDKRKFNPRIALTFALNSIKYCEKNIKNENGSSKHVFKSDENLWREKFWNSIEQYEKEREKLRYKSMNLQNLLKDETNFYKKKLISEFKMYQNCIRFFQNCCMKSMYFLTCFEEIYNTYGSNELCAIADIISKFAETSQKLYNLILTKENYERLVKNSTLPKFCKDVYFNKLEYFVKFYLTEVETTKFENIYKNGSEMRKFYFRVDENSLIGRKIFQSLLNYKNYVPTSSTIILKKEKLIIRFNNNTKLLKFFYNIVELDNFEKKLENSKLSLIRIFENNEENIPLYSIFLDIVKKNLFTKISHFKISTKEENYKLKYYSDQKLFKMCYDELEWNNSIFLYYLNTVFCYNTNIFQLAFYSKILNEKEVWTDFIIFLICFYCWNLSLHLVMRTRDLVDFRIKSNFIIDLNSSSIKILQNFCEGHNKTFQDFLFDFEFTITQVKDLYWGKSVYISKEERDKNIKYKIYNFINCNLLNLFNSLKRRIYPKDKDVLKIMQRYFDLIVEMIQGASMKNLKNVVNRLKFLDERTKFEKEYNYENVKKSYELIKKTDSKLTNKRFFMKHNFQKTDDLSNQELVKEISLKNKLNIIDLYDTQYFDFYNFISDIKQYLINDYYLVDEMVIRQQTLFFEYINNILKSDIDQDRKNGVDVLAKNFNVEDIIIILMKYFIMLKYKYRHNAKFCQDPNKKRPNTEIYNQYEIVVMNKEMQGDTKKNFIEPKLIELEEVFITEEEAKIIDEKERLDEAKGNKDKENAKGNNKVEDFIEKEKKKKLDDKIKFNNCNYVEFKELMRIYKQKTGPLYYHLEKEVYIYDDPIFQTSCKLMIYLKILAYKYQIIDAQKILDLNLNPFINQEKDRYNSNGQLKPETENDDYNDDQNLKQKTDDIKKIEKMVSDVFDQYNFKNNNKDHKYIPIIKNEKYKNTLIFCLQFFNKVIKSCEFVVPINFFKESQLIEKIKEEEEILDSEDDKDDDFEEEEDDGENMKKGEEDDKKNSEVNKRRIKKQLLKKSRSNNDNDPRNNINEIEETEEMVLEEIESDLENKEEKRKNKKNKEEISKREEKNEYDDENDQDWDADKKKKEMLDKALEHEKIQELLSQMKFENEKNDEETGNQLKKLHYIFNPNKYYKISKDNIKEFKATEADRSSPNNKISSFLEKIESFLIEIKYKSEIILDSFHMKYFFDKKNYKIVNIINCVLSLISTFYLILTIDEINYELEESYTFITFPLVIMIILNTFTIFMFIKARYPFLKQVEFNKLYEGKDEDYKASYIELIYAKYLNSLILHSDILFLILNLITSIIMLYRHEYIFLFCIQLGTIYNIVETVEEIFKAFYLKLDQLFALIILLFIISYIFGFIAFSFLKGEFNIETDSVR